VVLEISLSNLGGCGSAATVVPTSFAIIDPVLSTVIDVPVFDAPVENAIDQQASPNVQEYYVHVHIDKGAKGNNRGF
jgi:hypothetical protein